MKKNISLSLITICKDNVDELEKTLDSVDKQHLKVQDHIIIDSSQDKNALKIKALSQKIQCRYYWTKPDGIYSAMNEAIRQLAEDGFCMFLNAGDSLADERVFEVLRLEFNKQKINYWAIGNLVLSRDQKIIGDYVVPDDQKSFYSGLKNGSIWLPHPSTVYKIEALKAVGNYNEKFKISADYELGLRMFINFGFPEFLQFNLAIHELGGISSTSGVRPEIENCLARINVFGIRVLPAEIGRIIYILIYWIRKSGIYIKRNLDKKS